MTDDKAIEAAREAVLLEMKEFVDESLYAGGLMSDNMVDQIARASIVAADKARAEGFDLGPVVREVLGFAQMYKTLGTAAQHADAHLFAAAIQERIQNGFAAGLAKGEAERAALVEALEKIAKTFDESALRGSRGRRVGDIARDALALVRKGV